MNCLQTLKNLGIYFTCAICVGCSYASQGFPDEDRGAFLLDAVDDYGDIAKTVVYPEQNWDPSDSLWFYNTSQGSNLMDYQVFKYLEQSESPVEGKIKFFRDNDNMNKYRFLLQNVTSGNKDGLPVGWVKDTHDGKDYIGFTCAACHTSQLNYNGIGIRIDGGPSMADIQTMFTHLVQALKETLDEQDKFDRLANNILRQGPDGTKEEILQRLKNDYEK